LVKEPGCARVRPLSFSQGHIYIVRGLRLKALWQMSAVSRNGPGTKRLAQEYGFSKKELGQILRQYADKMRDEGNIKPLEPCYDYKTDKHLTLEQWLDQFVKSWDKLSES
jgi:hypothetical protein